MKENASTDDEDVDGAPIKDDFDDDDVDGKPLSEEEDIDGMPMDVEKPKGRDQTSPECS